ncbi:hypothetical protein H261_03293 [Paramagnetospirillum caucaseum]|uniref:Uncharacterized protein n=1 Tax=Paramagnetospirillum caucaseum TaxID=1244869 RepID=M2YEI9_9PROT|nr:hypothetical protein [Paramagnetospirillum caucaseum]EME71401.1 hypothetical protein H261_03293 [Paramagnetospirillum caucaseum]
MTRTLIDIEDLLVWAYKHQAVDEARGHVAGPGVALMRWDVAVDPCAAVDDVHPDAWTVHAHVRMLSRVQAGLVIASAKTATRPDWMPGAKVVMAQVLNGRGGPAKLYDDNRNVVGHRVRVALELADGAVLVGLGAAELEQARAMYSAWRAALVSLADALSKPALMEGYDVVFPCALSEPWKMGLTGSITKRY